jgi:hypothetical protein
MTDDPADVADEENWVRHPRQVFLTELWRLLVSEDDRVGRQPSWIESWSRGTPRGAMPDDPTAAALHRVLAAGADPDDLTDVVRTMQYEIINNVCQLLDDPSLLGIQREPGDEAAGSGVGWQLFATNGMDTSRRSPIAAHHGVARFRRSYRGSLCTLGWLWPSTAPATVSARSRRGGTLPVKPRPRRRPASSRCWSADPTRSRVSGGA